MIGHVKHFDSNKAMSFKVIDKGLLKRYIKIWEIISNLIGKEFDSEPSYGHNDKYIMTKNSYGEKLNTNFYGNKIPKEKASYKYLPLIMLDSIIRANTKYFPNTSGRFKIH